VLQVAPGGAGADGVEVVAPELQGFAGGGGVGQVLLLLDGDLDGAGEGLVIGGIAGVTDGGGAGEVRLGQEVDLVQDILAGGSGEVKDLGGGNAPAGVVRGAVLII